MVESRMPNLRQAESLVGRCAGSAAGGGDGEGRLEGDSRTSSRAYTNALRSRESGRLCFALSRREWWGDGTSRSKVKI